MRRLLKLGPALLVWATAGCDSSVTMPADPASAALDLTPLSAVAECDVVTFNSFTHGNSITAVSLFGGGATLNVTANRNDPAGAVDATAYDTGLWTSATAPNSTHFDTQSQIWCDGDQGGGLNSAGAPTDAACDGIMPVIPDVDFANDGDDTQGGSIFLTGFTSAYTWEVRSYWAVDDDEAGAGKDIDLYLDATLQGQSTGLGDGSVELVTATSSAVTTTAEFRLAASGGIDNVQVCRTPPPGGEGCTPGYWKQEHHFDSWTAPYTPSTLFADVFEDAFPTMTLLQVLKQGGGGLKALGRHTVAALLNAASPDTDYDLTVQGVIDGFNNVYPSSSKSAYNAQKDIFETFNEQGCPLN